MRQDYCYYRQHFDPKFLVSVLHSVNRLVQVAYHRGMHVLRVLGSMEQEKKLNKGLCRIAIRSSDYCVMSYVPVKRALTRSVLVNLLTAFYLLRPMSN